MYNRILISTHFTDLPNEIVLIIWMYLTHGETIKSFSSIKYQRYNQLLQTYCYKSIDFYTTKFSTFQSCCTQMLDQFRLNVQILKLGHRDSFSQLRIFSQYCLTSSSLLDVFPQLHTLVLRNVHDSDANNLVPYLSIIPYLEKFTLNKCPLSKISTLICEQLLNNSIKNRLTSCTLDSINQKDGIFISEPLSLSCQLQHSLIYLRIDVRDFTSLKYLLMFLPQLSTLDVHVGTDVKSSDQELFPLSFSPCCHLTKLLLRLRYMVVQDFMSIIKFILLFRNSLITLHLALIHQDPKFRHSLTYINGNHLFDEIVVHMKMMKDFSFWIETTCLCNRQMDNIIQSFQTTYWLTMHIGCYFDSINYVYVMFTLPYIFDLRFMIMNDIIHTRFNHTDDCLNCLIPMLYMKMPGAIVLIGENECLSGSFLSMLKQGSHRRKSIRIKPDGIYQLERNDHHLTQFNILEIRRRNEYQSSDQFINTTISWISWMPHIRILDIDHELLSQLIVNNINIDRFLSLEVLIVRQANSSLSNEPLTIISRLGISPSLHTIHLQQYRANSQLLTIDLFLVLHRICHNLSRLTLMTIEFHSNALFNCETLEKFTDIQKKNCHLDYISVSDAYIELCFAR